MLFEAQGCWLASGHLFPSVDKYIFLPELDDLFCNPIL